MTYWSLNAIFLGFAALVAIAAVVARRSPSWRGVGLAAVEDFPYAIAGLVLLPSLWSLLGGSRHARSARSSTTEGAE